jgi:hypothetical protein
MFCNAQEGSSGDESYTSNSMIKYERIFVWERETPTESCIYRFGNKNNVNLNWKGTGNAFTIIRNNIGVHFEEIHGYQTFSDNDGTYEPFDSEGEFNRYEIRVRYQTDIHYYYDSWTFEEFFTKKPAFFESCNYIYAYGDIAIGRFTGKGYVSECTTTGIGTPSLDKTAFEETHKFIDVGIGANVNFGLALLGGYNFAAEIRCGYGEGEHFGYRAFGEIGYTNTLVLPFSFSIRWTYQNWEQFFSNSSFSARFNIHFFM